MNETTDMPLAVFSGPWIFKDTGQSFSGADLDAAAYAVYRDRITALGESVMTSAEIHECAWRQGHDLFRQLERDFTRELGDIPKPMPVNQEDEE